MKKLTPLMGNSQWLDGGAMFGNAPKAMWEKWVEVDDHNRIHLASRALLVQESDRTILLEAGVGAFFDPKLKDRYGVLEDRHVLLESLAEHNLTHEDIDIVILSHLHFDHAGGLLSAWQADKPCELLFPNAQFVVSQTAWERANNPHRRDKASFLPHLNQLLSDSGRLVLVEDAQCDLLGTDYQFHYTHGHTPGMLHTEVTHPDGNVFFAADLIPGTAWVHLPITMGYDRCAETVIDEKTKLLPYFVENNVRLFYTHDIKTAMSGVVQNEKGRYVVSESRKTK